MSARDHLQPELFDPGPRLSAEEQDAAEHARMGRQVATFGEIGVGMPRSSAESVAVTGTIMTQHETGDSQGAYNPSLREGVEDQMGYSSLPVYGALRRSPTEPIHYGNVNFHLKSSVKDRSAMYLGDSLNDASVGPVETAGIRDVAEGYDTAPQPMEPWEDYESTRYVEAHILADERPETQGAGDAARVPLSDVDRVTISDSGSYFRRDTHNAINRPKNFELGRQFADAGIPVDHSLVDEIEQPSLPMKYHDGPQPSSKFSLRRRLVPHAEMSGRDRWGSE